MPQRYPKESASWRGEILNSGQKGWVMKRFFTALIALVSLSVLGCDSGAGERITPGDLSQDTAADLLSDADTTSPPPDLSEICPQAASSDDCDGDGLPNNLEQSTGTSWVDPDSDDDGLCDGPDAVSGSCQAGEDLNANGMVDPGEYDPRLWDTRGIGCSDLEQVENNGECLPPQLLELCGDDAFATAQATLLSAVESVAVVPEGFTVTPVEGLDAVLLSNPTSRVYGYFTRQETTETLGVAHIQNMARINVENINRVDLSTRFPSGFERDRVGEAAPRNGALTLGTFSYGAGGDNPEPAQKDPAQLRDEIVSALLEGPVDAGERGRPCALITYYHLSELRDDGVLISVGAVVCEEDLWPDVRSLLRDLTSTTLHAPVSEGHTPDGRRCEVNTVTEVIDAVDFLWVIDSAGSMRAEQDKLASVMPAFVDRLRQSAVDWRVAVTSADAYCLGEAGESLPTCRARAQRDRLRDPCTGLRSTSGFLDVTDDVEGLLPTYITDNPGCDDPLDPADVGRNVCGASDSSALSSARRVIEQFELSPEERPSECPAEPSKQLRDADLHVIVLSDREDATMKQDGAPLPEGSPERAAMIERFVDFSAPRRATLHALGGQLGGPCEPLLPGGAEGAEDALSYAGAAQATGGEFYSVCLENYEVVLERLMNAIVGPDTIPPKPYTLQSWPVLSTLRVETDRYGLLARGDGGEARPHWDYSPASNEVILYNVGLRAGDIVTFAYRSWVSLGASE